MRKIAELTKEQEQYVLEHFHDTKNDTLAKELGVDPYAIRRFGKRRCLKKSDQFMRNCRLEAAEAAKISNEIHGRFRKKKGLIIPGSEIYRFKKGVSNNDRYGEDKCNEIYKKSLGSRIKTIKRERARIAFGLPQETRIRLGAQSRSKIIARHYLKKLGYHIDNENRIAYYDNNTHRGKYIEKKEKYWFKFMPMPTDETVTK